MSDLIATDNLSTLPAVVRWLGAIAFIVALPLFVILGNVLDVAGDREFYLSEFSKYGVGQVTGLDQPQLHRGLIGSGDDPSGPSMSVVTPCRT